MSSKMSINIKCSVIAKMSDSSLLFENPPNYPIFSLGSLKFRDKTGPKPNPKPR